MYFHYFMFIIVLQLEDETAERESQREATFQITGNIDRNCPDIKFYLL